MNRPSHKELFGKLRAARKAVEQKCILLLNQAAIAADAIELDYSLKLDLIDVLTEILNACSPADYTGARPPQRSYEQELKGLELFAFTVESQRFKCRVYLKFIVMEDALWIVSLHQHRPEKEEP
jgi:hypothetical protein